MSDSMNRASALAALAAVAAAATILVGRRPSESAPSEHFSYTLSDAQWRVKLSPEAYDVLRHEGTEYAGTSPLLNEHRAGTFVCAGCALALFDAKTKYDSGTGWPSFYQPLPHAVGERRDDSLGMARTEVHCSRCGGHLGHVFDDGPQPTGLRYCMNGVAMSFEPRAKT